MMGLLNDVLIRCADCGRVIGIRNDEIEFESYAYDRGENSMGDEIEFRHDGCLDCECGN